jgi:hypothetical protein
MRSPTFGRNLAGEPGGRRGQRTSIRIARSAAIFLPLCFGCVSTPAAPVVLDQGKSIWQRVETEHFTVEDDLESDPWTIRIAGEFETLGSPPSFVGSP